MAVLVCTRLVGIFHVPSPAGYLSAFSSYLDCCLEWPFCVLVVCGSFLLWKFLPVSGVGQLAFQGLMVREACVSVLVHGTGFLLSGVQWSVQ